MNSSNTTKAPASTRACTSSTGTAILSNGDTADYLECS